LSIKLLNFSISKDDPFLANYLAIYEKTLTDSVEKINFGIFRNDFMIDKIKQFIYQIEINTIACAGEYFTDNLKAFHIHFAKKYLEYFEKYQDHVPLDNESTVDNMVHSMRTAIKLQHQEPNETIVVFVIQEGEKNEYEHRAIEWRLWEL
jgi:hypothetical protein